MLIGQAAPKDMGFDLRGKTHIPTQSRVRIQRSVPAEHSTVTPVQLRTRGALRMRNFD